MMASFLVSSKPLYLFTDSMKISFIAVHHSFQK